jgi:hypothetical protein
MEIQEPVTLLQPNNKYENENKRKMQRKLKKFKKMKDQLKLENDKLKEKNKNIARRRNKCWVCVIFFSCVCVGTSYSTTASDGPSREVPGEPGMPPLGYAQHSGQRPEIFFLGHFCHF